MRIAKALIPHGFQPVAFCTPEAGSVAAFFRGAGVPACVYRSVELSYRRPGPFLKASFELARSLRREKIALVHCSDLMAGLRVALAARIARIPMVCHIRNPHESIPRRDIAMLRAINHFIFVSRHAWTSFGYHVTPSRGSLIYDGIEIIHIDQRAARESLAARLRLDPHAKLVGMVARLAVQKDFPTFIRAASRIVPIYPSARFLIVGDHTGTEAFRQHHQMLTDLLHTHRLTSHVIFTGFQEGVAELLAGLDVFVLSTHFEGFGLVIIEAMAQQRPVVATAVGGVIEIIQDQKNGLLHRHEDDADLAAKILALLSDETLAERLGQAGRRSVEERFSVSRFAESVAGVYAALVR
jgi:glycosyltransferase involved in cell wall biosynthesis